MKPKSNQDWPVTIISLSGIGLVVVLLAINPEAGKAFIGKLFGLIVGSIGSPLLWFGAFALIYSLYMAFSKYGNIKLGDKKPTYSLFSYISMMICAGLGSSSVYWSLTEWTYYYGGPPFGIEPLSASAAEWATAYNMFHWGWIPWATFVVTVIPVAYAFHVRKISALRLSLVCEEMMGNFKYKRIVGRLVDIVVIFGIAGCCSVLLGLGIPMISNGFSKVTGIPQSFGLNVALILVITVVFTISSYLGTEKGMQKISQFNIYAAIGFMLFLLFYGNTDFILRQTTNGFGIMVQNFFRMSTYTDPVLKGGFPDSWTIFFIAYGYAFSMLMILFITKISEGRTIREMACSVIFGGSTGCFIFFGINGSFAMGQHLAGKMDFMNIINTAGGDEAIMQLFGTMPLGKVVTLFFITMAGLFLATTLDSAAFSLSASTTKALGSGENTSPIIRLFWCIVLAAIPLAMIFIGAPLSALKLLIIIVAIPIMALCLFMVIRLRAWLKEDFENETTIQKTY